MLNKLACPTAALRWNFPLRDDPMSADRSVFDLLSKHHKGLGTGKASVYYTLNLRDGLHPLRLQRMGAAYDAVGKAE